MAQTQTKQKEVKLTLNAEELSPNQVRLIRGINQLLTTVLTSHDEAEYFNSSAELMKLVASAVKQANFGTAMVAGDEAIAYTQQALEFSLDLLSEHIEENKVITYDN